MNGSADEVTSDANSGRREEDTRAVAVAATVQEDDGRGVSDGQDTLNLGSSVAAAATLCSSKYNP